MYGSGKSDGLVVPGKPLNKGLVTSRSAERVEERGPAKRNLGEQTRLRTQCRIDLKHALFRIREAKGGKKVEQLTALQPCSNQCFNVITQGRSPVR